MEWSLAIVALAVLALASVSGRIAGTPVTPAMLFVGIGLLVGPRVLDELDLASTSSTVQTLAEATLALVLFSDASRINLRELRRDANVPARLLGIGLPLTIALGAVSAVPIFGQLSLEEALILAVVLAPTDAALGQAVVTEPRVPPRIRQGLNVESGLNDGICVPLLFIAVAAADVHSDLTGGRDAGTLVLEEIGYGIAGGVLAGLVVAAIVRVAGRRHLIDGAWLQVVPAAGAGLAYGIAIGLDGSGFIAAFVAGGVFGGLLRRDPAEVNRLAEEVGNVLNGVTFLIFGAVLLGPALGHLSWDLVLYAALSLTVVRMLPVAIAMLGTSARPITVAFMGWFGPRGLASIVFALILLEESNLPHEQTVLLAIYLTVGLSVLVHGITAAPLADRYGRWYDAHPRPARSIEA
jgi:NhaP-type Na+/H+ or K+/H+ antiporter